MEGIDKAIEMGYNPVKVLFSSFQTCFVLTLYYIMSFLLKFVQY